MRSISLLLQSRILPKVLKLNTVPSTPIRWKFPFRCWLADGEFLQTPALAAVGKALLSEAAASHVFWNKDTEWNRLDNHTDTVYINRLIVLPAGLRHSLT
jgi:hypothetical protein